MATTAVASNQLRKGAKVVATTELRDVPEGTPGKVIMVTGLTWIRYWVRFDNGVSLGSISRDRLATPQDLEDRANGVSSAEVEDTSDAAADAGDVDDGGGVTTPNGTFVSQKHIDRAKAARARLTGG